MGEQKIGRSAKLPTACNVILDCRIDRFAIFQEKMITALFPTNQGNSLKTSEVVTGHFGSLSFHFIQYTCEPCFSRAKQSLEYFNKYL